LHLVSKKPYFYHELLTRVVAPSFSGRILEYFPSVKLFSPHADNFSKKWKKGPPLLNNYQKVELKESTTKSIKIFVSLGTMSPFRFDRLIDQLLPCLERDDDITWQLGCTTRIGLPGKSLEIISNNDFLNFALLADVVVCHGGVGSLLDLVTHGVRPIVIPRLVELGEHVDNHQVELTRYFSELDLIHYCDSTITRQDLVESSGFRLAKR
jgi:UDP-N-acetylglucosamine transferase subunit ALG13